MINEKKGDRLIRWSLVGSFAGCVLGAICGVIYGVTNGNPAMEHPLGGAAVGAMRGLTTGLVFGLPAGLILGTIASLLFPKAKIMQEDGDGPVTRIYGEERSAEPEVSDTSEIKTEEKKS